MNIECKTYYNFYYNYIYIMQAWPRLRSIIDKEIWNENIYSAIEAIGTSIVLW